MNNNKTHIPGEAQTIALGKKKEIGINTGQFVDVHFFTLHFSGKGNSPSHIIDKAPSK